MKLSLSGRLFEIDYRENVLPIEEFIKLAKDIGYDGVELRDTQVSLKSSAEEVQRMVNLVNKYGIEVTCMTPRNLPIKEDFHLFEKYLSLVKQLGCRLVKVGAEGEVSWIRRAADYAAKYGIRMAGNNHIGNNGQVGVFETVESTISRLKEIDHENYGLIYDPAHLFMAQSEYGKEAIKKLSDYIFYVTVQCPCRVPNGVGIYQIEYKGFYYRMGLIGDRYGMDFHSIFNGLKAVRYNGYVSVIQPMMREINGIELVRLMHDNLREEM